MSEASRPNFKFWKFKKNYISGHHKYSLFLMLYFMLDGIILFCIGDFRDY